LIRPQNGGRIGRRPTSMQSNNPVLTREDVFSPKGYSGFGSGPATAEADRLEEMFNQPAYAPPRATARMTLDDVVNKMAILLVVIVATAAGAWFLNVGYGVAIVAALVGFGLAMANTFRKVVSPALVIAYAAVEGVFLGAISHWLNTMYSGIVVQAVLGTMAAFAVMLALYKSGKIRVTPTFQKVLLGLGLGYMVFLGINLIFSLFGAGVNLWGNGLLPVAISIFAVGLASFFLVLDFDLIEKALKSGVPERESWRAAFGLTVTLIWLYVEMLRLLAILRSD